MMSLGPGPPPSLCAALLCVGFKLCLALWGRRVLPSSSHGAVFQLGITIEREHPLPHDTSKNLSIRSHWTSWGHVLFFVLVTVGCHALIGPAWRGKCGVSSIKAREGTHGSIKMKGPDREMETRQASQRCPSQRSESACLWSSASNSGSIHCVLCA